MNTWFGFEPWLFEALIPKCPRWSRLGVVAFSHRGCFRRRRLLAIEPPRAQRHRMARSACLLTPSSSAEIKMIIQPSDMQ